MTIFDVVRNAVLAGFGVQEKVTEFVNDLIKKGELSESQGARLVKEWTEKADKTSFDLNKNITELISRTMEKMNIPTKEEYDRLNKRVETLSARISKLEGSSEDGEE